MSYLKYHDVAWGSFTPGTQAGTKFISGVKQGTGGTERVGDRINMVAVHVRGAFKLETPPSYAFVCWSLVLDRQSNGATTLDAADVYTTPGGGSSPSTLSLPRLDTADRFAILYESPVYELIGTSTVPTDKYVVFIDECILVNVQSQLSVDPDPGLPDPALTNALYIVMRRNNSPDVTALSGYATLYFDE